MIKNIYMNLLWIFNKRKWFKVAERRREEWLESLEGIDMPKDTLYLKMLKKFNYDKYDEIKDCIYEDWLMVNDRNAYEELMIDQKHEEDRIAAGYC